MRAMSSDTAPNSLATTASEINSEALAPMMCTPGMVIDPEHLVYASESVKPGPGGSVSLMLTPMQLLDRLAALTPPPRPLRQRVYQQPPPSPSTRRSG